MADGGAVKRFTVQDQAAWARRGRPGRASRAGLTLVEIAVAMTVMIMVLLGFSRALLDSMKAAGRTRESAVATDAARQVMESLKGEGFATLFAANNSVVGDDPAGVTLRLAAFDVPGLNPRQGDADGLCGEILLPERVALGVSQLREDVEDFALTMPRDLNGDGLIDGDDHSGDYRILPVLVRVDWQGVAGEGRVQFKTILSEYGL